jgi:hypothetical protein
VYERTWSRPLALGPASPDDPTSPPFPVDTSLDEGDARGDPVVLTDVDLGRHGTYDRVVVEVADGGHAGWEAEYVDQATAQGSGQTIAIAGDAILRLTLTNMNYPTGSTLEQIEPGTRYDGVGDIAAHQVAPDVGEVGPGPMGRAQQRHD